MYMQSLSYIELSLYENLDVRMLWGRGTVKTCIGVKGIWGLKSLNIEHMHFLNKNHSALSARKDVVLPITG